MPNKHAQQLHWPGAVSQLVLASCACIGCGGGDDPFVGDCDEPWSEPVQVPTGDILMTSPTITADERELFADDMGGAIYVMTRRDRSAAWSTPVESGVLGFNPSVSEDGLRLYFSDYFMGNTLFNAVERPSRTAPFGAHTRGQGVALGTGDVFRDQRSLYATDVGAPISVWSRDSVARAFAQMGELDAVVNDGSDNVHPSISHDGLELYFARVMPGESGHRIMVAKRSAIDAPFTSVEPLFPGNRPEISPDGRSLYFNANFLTLYVSTRCLDQ